MQEHILVGEPLEQLKLFNVTGTETIHPIDGSVVTWISEQYKDVATQAGFRMWDVAEYLILHLSYILCQVRILPSDSRPCGEDSASYCSPGHCSHRNLLLAQAIPQLSALSLLAAVLPCKLPSFLILKFMLLKLNPV